jgi:cell division protein FtsW
VTITIPGTSAVADRRRQALERLHNGSVPVRAKRNDRRQTEPRPAMWDVQRGPAPVAYYVIGIVVAVFVMLGLVMVLSASSAVESAKGNSPYHVFGRQVTWACFGLVGMLIAMRMHVAWVRRLAIPLAALAAAGMALPFVPSIGATINDARAWVTVGSFSVQPSEFLKLALVLFCADLLVRRQDVLADVRRSLRPVALVAACAAGACLVQGDLGSAIVMCAIVLAVAFIGGVPMTPMVLTGILAIVAAVGFVFSTEYRHQRFTAFLDVAGHRDHLSYQAYQSALSIADGGLTGSGIGAGNGKLGYLPLAHSDFIFAVIADELGMVGAVAVVGGFMLLTWFGIQAALSAPDRFGMLLAGGITAWFGVQAVINLGGVTGLMPVTGLTLPFFSAGGSSLFVSMTAAGLLLNVARRAR